jgi:phosphotransacetylase
MCTQTRIPCLLVHNVETVKALTNIAMHSVDAQVCGFCAQQTEHIHHVASIVAGAPYPNIENTAATMQVADQILAPLVSIHIRFR